jgi:YaiO family outer membrane protein
MLKTIFSMSFLLFLSLTLSGQKDTTNRPVEILEISSDADSAFAQARELAYSKEYDASRKILDLLIYQSPTNYYQYKLFKARTLVWDGKYAPARSIIEELILEDTTVIDIYQIRLNNERYDKDFPLAIRYANDGIKRFPKDNEFFHVGKVQSLVAENRYHEGLDAATLALDSFPENNELKQLKTFLLNQLIVDGLAVGVSMDYFSKIYKPWLFGFLQYGRQTKIGAIIGRVNVADRQRDATVGIVEPSAFASLGVQGEIDIFPRLSKNSYMYLNVGYSPSSIFPSFRFGAEYYSMIGNTELEGSLGIRYLDFLTNIVTMYTGSLGYYWDSEYINFRPFFINDAYGWGSTYNFLYRQFFSGKGDFIQVTFGGGVVPDERVLLLNNGLVEQNYRLDNQYVGIGYQKLVNQKFYSRLDLTITRQENFSQQNDYLFITSLGLILGYRL